MKKVPGRTHRKQITYFGNNMGMGIQFAAVGYAVYNEALKRGIGKQLPLDWFSQLNHT
jgi:alanine dehydrogenase